VNLLYREQLPKVYATALPERDSKRADVFAARLGGPYLLLVELEMRPDEVAAVRDVDWWQRPASHSETTSLAPSGTAHLKRSFLKVQTDGF
jgi:hypothetical protein